MANLGPALHFAALRCSWWRFGRGPEVAAVAPTRGTAVEIVYATGAVEPVRWAKVASLIRDRIVELCYCEGKTVAKGDVLARLDDREVRAQLQELQGARGFRQARAGARHRADRTRRRDHPGLRARLDRPAPGAGADLRADGEARQLHHHRADGRRRAAPGRRGRRDRRARPDPVPGRRAQAVAGGRRGQRGRHPARCRRPEGAAAHRCLPRPAARGNGARDHARWAIRSPRPTASASPCPTTRRCSSA